MRFLYGYILDLVAEFPELDHAGSVGGSEDVAVGMDFKI
jgi:hypothetical protein